MVTLCITVNLHPPRILEKQQKNEINVSSAWWLLFNSAVSWVISTDSTRLPCFVPCASRYLMPGKSTCQHWMDGLTETYSKQQRVKLERELESDDSVLSMSKGSHGEAPTDLNEMEV